jgi:hypothetical protein
VLDASDQGLAKSFGRIQSAVGRPVDDEMSEERDIAEGYRVRAEEIRTIASIDRHFQTRELLLRVAADYDKMAITMDNIARTNEVLRKS